MNLFTSNSSKSDTAMSGARYVAVLLALLGVVTGGIYLAGMAIELEDTISSENYLAKLNDNDTYGCKNSIRINPEIIVFGDSHAYAALDFNMLADSFGTRKIAACTLGGTFLESVLFGLQHYESLGKLPKTVIFSTSTRQFWNPQRKKAMLFSHKSQITAINSGDLLFSVQNILAWLFRRDSHEFRDARERVKVHTPQVEALDEKIIAEILAGSVSSSKHMTSWLRRIDEAEFTEGVEELIAQIGEIIKHNNIELFVVAVPESPWLEKQYDPWIVERYHALLDSFKPFADVLVYSTQDIGLGNRHFINRSLKADYDYAKWSDPSFVASTDLDADHIGGVGAIQFTKVVARDMIEARAARQ